MDNEAFGDKVISLRSEYKDFVFNFTDFIWEVDEHGIYTYAAGKTKDILGYEPHEIIGKTPFDFMPLLEADKIKNIFGSIVKNEASIVDLENWNVTKTGKLVCLLTNGKPIYDENGKFSGYHGVDKDITEKKILETQLRELNENLQKQVDEKLKTDRKKDRELLVKSRVIQMGEMISMIAHQWRQPLSTITTIASNLKVTMDLNNYDLNNLDQRNSFLSFFETKIENILFQTNILTNIIDNFKNFYKIDEEQTYTELENPIAKALHVLDQTFVNKNIEIKKNIKCNETVLMYENELMHVLLNILKNSLDNFKERKIDKPTILIETKCSESNQIIEITDNGFGIENTIIDRVFEPYFSTKKEKNGTGLGLYMSKTIVEKHHNGNLFVKNIFNKEKKVSGVCFIIELPI